MRTTAKNNHFIAQSEHVTIDAADNRLPIEVTVIGKFPKGAGKEFLLSANRMQAQHPEFVDEYNEASALIGKTNFAKNDPTAVYTFSVDKRDLVFHRHAGHRVIVGITGSKGCLLKFSLCTPEEAERDPLLFLKKMRVISIPGDRLFNLRFDGTTYHQFCPLDRTEEAFFAVSVHTNEAGGLSGELLEKVLANEGSIPLLTEPASATVMQCLNHNDAYQHAVFFDLDIP
jgi:hypothetical protein